MWKDRVKADLQRRAWKPISRRVTGSKEGRPGSPCPVWLRLWMAGKSRSSSSPSAPGTGFAGSWLRLQWARQGRIQGHSQGTCQPEAVAPWPVSERPRGQLGDLRVTQLSGRLTLGLPGDCRERRAPGKGVPATRLLGGGPSMNTVCARWVAGNGRIF